VLAGGDLRAQLPAGRLFTVSPAGAKQGTAVEVTVGGADLDGVRELRFSHPGIQAAPKEGSPQFVVTIGPEVPRGVHEVRALGRFGLTNPRAFAVGGLEESVEKEPNSTPGEANPVALETTVNGVIDGAADRDCFRFQAAKGDRILLECSAYRIDSRLDATLVLYEASGREIGRVRGRDRRDALLDFEAPLDGEYVVEVHDLLYRGGGEYPYRLSIGKFARLDYVFPPCGLPGTKGSYTVYGRNLPGGQPAGVELAGRPLEKIEVEIEIPPGDGARPLASGGVAEGRQAGLEGTEHQLGGGAAGPSASFVLGHAAAAVILEREKNDAPAEAQQVAVPCEVAGQFYPENDEDWVAFETKQGEVFKIETISHRLGCATDPFIVVQQVERAADGKESVKELAAVDDLGGDVGTPGFATATEDASYRFQAPADGWYRVGVRDLYGAVGAEPSALYRLAIRREAPDFSLVALPRDPGPEPKNHGVWSLLLRRGGRVLVDVAVFRRDGFGGPIELAVEGLPAGVRSAPATAAAGATHATLVLEAAADAPAWAGFVTVVGRAQLGGADVVRKARGAALTWPGQENVLVPRARLASGLAIAVSAGETDPLSVQVVAESPPAMARGGKLTVPVRVERRGSLEGEIKLAGVGQPKDVEVKSLSIKPDASEGTLEIELKAGAPTGTFTFHLTSEVDVNYVRDADVLERANALKTEKDRLALELEAAVKKSEEEKAAAEKAAPEKAEAAKAAQAALGPASEALAAASRAALDAAGLRAAACEAALKASPDDAAAREAVAAALKASGALEAKVNDAAAAVLAVEKAAQAARAEALAVLETKAAKEKEIPELAEKLKAAKTEQEKAAKDAEAAAAAAKPKKTKVHVPSPLSLTIAPVPFELDIALELEGGVAKLAKGGKLELPLKLKRLYGFADPVRVEAALPQGLGGLKGAAIEVAKESAEGTLVLEAALDAPAGRHSIALKATSKLNNVSGEILKPLVLEIVEPPPPAAPPEAPREGTEPK
jgi:hypothetical protein